MSGTDLMSWPVFADRPLDRHACGLHCPYYKGKADYDPKHLAGLQKAFSTAVRLPMSEFFTVADIDAMARAVAKVAAFYHR